MKYYRLIELALALNFIALCKSLPNEWCTMQSVPMDAGKLTGTFQSLVLTTPLNNNNDTVCSYFKIISNGTGPGNVIIQSDNENVLNAVATVVQNNQQLIQSMPKNPNNTLIALGTDNATYSMFLKCVWGTRKIWFEFNIQIKILLIFNFVFILVTQQQHCIIYRINHPIPILFQRTISGIQLIQPIKQ